MSKRLFNFIEYHFFYSAGADSGSAFLFLPFTLFGVLVSGRISAGRSTRYSSSGLSKVF